MFKDQLQMEILHLLQEENPGILVDEAYAEANKILYGKTIYERAKYNLFEKESHEL
jgi:hypothetical protein